MKIHSASLVTREMQIQAIMTHITSYTKIIIIQKTGKNQLLLASRENNQHTEK